MDYGEINLEELVISTSNIAGVAIKQELMDNFDRSQSQSRSQSQPQPTHDVEIDEIKEEPIDPIQVLSVHVNHFPTVSKIENPNLVRPIVHRRTGKISIQNYLRRRRNQAIHSLPRSLCGVTVPAEQNSVNANGEFRMSSVAFAIAELHDDDETEPMQTEAMQTDGFSDGTGTLDDAFPMVISGAQKKRPQFFVALKKPVAKARNNAQHLPVKPDVVELSDDNMNDEIVKNQPVANPQATVRNQQQPSLPPAPVPVPAQNSSYCHVCRQQLANAGTYRKHLKSLKHQANLQQ